MQVYFTVIIWKDNLGTQAVARLKEGVLLVWGPLNTGFTVIQCKPRVFNPFTNSDEAEYASRNKTEKFHFSGELV